MNSIMTRHESAAEIRRGICLLNAGQFDKAAAAFSRAAKYGSTDRSLASYLAACYLGEGRMDAAAECFAEALSQGKTDTAVRVRHALALWSAGKREDALQSLREGIRLDRECAELHFQLGTFLTSMERFDEAELRFTQALTIDRHHVETLVSLALCCALRSEPSEALSYLRRAQDCRPLDARIGMLLAQAATAARYQGSIVPLRARMPDVQPIADARGIAELSRVIEADPDFVDAFLSIPVKAIDKEVFAMLLVTLNQALERQPEHAELHYHCGRVLARLGRRQDAIHENERAVHIDPTFARALIELGRLYRDTDRSADAATRLEQAIAAGAKYADVYFLLGGLYRDQGHVDRARSAFQQALSINNRYEAAQDALAALPA